MAMPVRNQKFRIKKGDTVLVIAGKDRGKRSKVMHVAVGASKVFVEKLNLIKRHVRPSKASKGGIIEKEGGMHVSKVMVVCPHCDKATRTGLRVIDSGERLRFCKKCGEIMDRA